MINSKWFDSKAELLTFMILLVAGVASSFATFHLLDGYTYNSGKNLAGVFVPPVLSLFYCTGMAYKSRLNNAHLVKTLILYCLQIAPFAPLFFQVFRPVPADDFSRYYLYAKNMIDHHTLWGGDSLAFAQAGRHFMSQPGYRYFVYAELLLFRDLYRFVSFLNICLYITGVFYFQKLIQQSVIEKRLQTCMLLLVLLFTPYAIKNLLMGLSEWLTVLLLMLSGYFYIVSKRVIPAVFLLGLAPFFRQNLLITVMLLAGWVLMHNRGRLKLLVVFCIALFLPLYHNLYYAGTWRFFVDIHEMPFLSHARAGNPAPGIDYGFIANNTLHYLGVDVQNGKAAVSMIAALFLPFATIVYFMLVKSIPVVTWKLVYVFVTMSAILPAILLGSAYYPRFEFVNVGVILVAYLLLMVHLPFRYDRV